MSEDEGKFVSPAESLSPLEEAIAKVILGPLFRQEAGPCIGHTAGLARVDFGDTTPPGSSSAPEQK